MENLKRVIGLAPSELPFDELIKLLQQRRELSREYLASYTPRGRKPSSKKKKTTSAESVLKKKLASGEITMEQIENLLK